MKKKILIHAALATLVITSCSTPKEKKDFSFDVMEAKVVAPATYIIQGNRFSEDIFLSAHSSSVPFEIKLDSTGNPNQTITYKNGVCTYEAIADSLGVQRVSGSLLLKSPDGKAISYPFSSEYVVAKMQAQIVPLDFVLYRGKENRLNISVPSISPNDLGVIVSNGTVSGDKGIYTVVPGKENKCMITITMDSKEGPKKVDAQEYNVVDK